MLKIKHNSKIKKKLQQTGYRCGGNSSCIASPKSDCNQIIKLNFYFKAIINYKIKNNNYRLITNIVMQVKNNNLRFCKSLQK